MFKKFDMDLPETIVPDEQLRFILDSLLQYTIALMPSDGEYGISNQICRYP